MLPVLPTEARAWALIESQCSVGGPSEQIPPTLSKLSQSCIRHGLSSVFYHHDLRRAQTQGLWPSLDMIQNPDKLEAALKKLLKVLVADSYGNVRAISWARNVYNSRLVREKGVEIYDLLRLRLRHRA